LGTETIQSLPVAPPWLCKQGALAPPQLKQALAAPPEDIYRARKQAELCIFLAPIFLAQTNILAG
jgi:hypothetical protein